MFCPFELAPGEVLVDRYDPADESHDLIAAPEELFEDLEDDLEAFDF